MAITTDTAGSGAPEAQSLEKALLALQKTLSRVSRDTATVRTKTTEAACAIMVGAVQFRLAVTTKLNAGEERLLLDTSGPITLELSGTIQTDVRSTLQPGEEQAENCEAPVGD